MMMRRLVQHSFWQSYALVVARLLMGGMFLMAAYMKVFSMGGINGTAGYIAGVGIPFPLVGAWLATVFELGIGIAFITGACFKEAALLTIVYVIFLTVMFHGPSTWTDQAGVGFGFFVDHLTLMAGLLFMVAHGPGETLVVKQWQME
jgi:putative oxidoreductase